MALRLLFHVVLCAVPAEATPALLRSEHRTGVDDFELTHFRQHVSLQPDAQLHRAVLVKSQLNVSQSPLTKTLGLVKGVSIIVRLLVIGEVSRTTARVLLEVEPSTTISTIPIALSVGVTSGSKQHMPLDFEGPDDLARLQAGLPVVFRFVGLSPGIRYNVKFLDDLTAPALPNGASFATFEQGADVIGTDGLNVGMVSCNKYSLTHLEIQPRTPKHDLWLALENEAPKLDVLLHLGDDVYIDDDRHLWKSNELVDEAAKTDSSMVLQWCMYCQAEQLLLGKDLEADWEPHRSVITELFRSMYRKTWGYAPTARTMANVPNLFVADDHETRDGWGDKTEDYSPSAKETWISRIAFDVASEYEYSLMEDTSTNAKKGSGFGHTIVGNVGILFVDTRYSKTFDSDAGVSPMFEKYLGAAQWSFLRQSLRAGGVFDDVTALIVAVPIPVVFIGRKINKEAQESFADLLGMWDNFPEEQYAFLSLLRDWKLNQPRQSPRELVIASGDVHFGMLSSVYFGKDHVFNQITTSAVSNRQVKQDQLDAVNLLIHAAGNGLSKDLSWENGHPAEAKRNYGKLVITLDKHGGAPKMLSEIYVTDEKGGSKLSTSVASSEVVKPPDVAKAATILASAWLLCNICCVAGMCAACYRCRRSAVDPRTIPQMKMFNSRSQDCVHGDKYPQPVVDAPHSEEKDSQPNLDTSQSQEINTQPVQPHLEPPITIPAAEPPTEQSSPVVGGETDESQPVPVDLDVSEEVEEKTEDNVKEL